MAVGNIRIIMKNNRLIYAINIILLLLPLGIVTTGYSKISEATPENNEEIIEAVSEDNIKEDAIEN